eukprot:2368849-Pleurochrysis_carterae.AAC.1
MRKETGDMSREENIHNRRKPQVPATSPEGDAASSTTAGATGAADSSSAHENLALTAQNASPTGFATPNDPMRPNA